MADTPAPPPPTDSASGSTPPPVNPNDPTPFPGGAPIDALDIVDELRDSYLTYAQSGTNTLVYADADGGGDNNVLMATLLETIAADVQTYTLI